MGSESRFPGLFGPAKRNRAYTTLQERDDLVLKVSAAQHPGFISRMTNGVNLQIVFGSLKQSPICPLSRFSRGPKG